ncbi:serine/threonine-protein kinase pakD [Onthophagus taurus]|uniref:serine/threonine-protein kinase pakD n=1 Tax=Onthophagus taurus TaxID=166361 RepID=UPI000C20517D|nr:myosin-G heavy chain [Onthophagus taurus]
MSVLNQSGEEQVECPLCMEPLEVDDLNFYPCTCGYQICRFCWHRIRTDENGLCPACRKAYSENPADFTPLSKEQVAQLKAEKRQRDQQRKAKQTESRKHLASVRVVQRNLVFVVGLPMRLADPEILKRHEYFGKFGKIHKVVINQSTAYAGSQGPSASAYVTYMKNDDALRAIQSVNNIPLDGRHIKSSLGTTKYCSHFMKNQPCPKPDCMYLHDFGDPEASFTKEQMHAGKHQEYEKKLHEALLNRTTQSKIEVNEKRGEKVSNGKESSPNSAPTNQTNGTSITNSSNNGTTVNVNVNINVNTSSVGGQTSLTVAGGPHNGVKEGWPQLINNDNNKKEEKRELKVDNNLKKIINNGNSNNRNNNNNKINNKKEKKQPPSPTIPRQSDLNDSEAPSSELQQKSSEQDLSTLSKVVVQLLDDNSSFFSHQNSYQKLLIPPTERAPSEDDSETSSSTTPLFPSQILNDSFPDISTAEDWEAAFGFSKHSNHLEELARQKCCSTTTTTPSTYNYYQDNFVDSKFFNDFVKTTSKEHLNGFYQNQNHNGVINGYGNSSLIDSHVRLVQQQQQQHQQRHRHLEDQLLLLNLKQGPQFMQQHGAGGNHYLNGEQRFSYQNQFGSNRTAVAPPSVNKQQRSEDDLDFDPFQETQKGLAELIENDQSLKLHLANSNGQTSQMNGLLHSQGGNGMLPPPPPGFVQPHMNSFGSKILPYLNMNSQQLNSTQNNWPSSYNNVLHQPQQQQQQQHKGMGACNDWKVLDPAIVSSSSRYFSLSSVPQPLRDHYGMTQQQQNGPSRQFEFGGGQQSGYHPNGGLIGQMQQQQQPSQGYNFAQQNLHWLGAELGSQISTPPGFRSQGQATKQQQEC